MIQPPSAVSTFLSRAFFGISLSVAAYLWIDYMAVDGVRYRTLWPVLLTLPPAYWCVYRNYRHFGRYYDRMFEDLLASDFAHADRPVVLYLRPFASDRNLHIKTGVFESILPMFFSGSAFDGRLAGVIQKRYLFVRFDGQPEPSRLSTLRKFDDDMRYRPAVHVTSENEWRELVRKTSEIAEICVVIPPTTLDSSTTDEVRMLIERGFQQRTIFVMPGKSTSFKSAGGTKTNAKSLWAQLQRLLNGTLELPDYSRSGGFVLPIDGEMVLVRSCAGVEWSHRRAMSRIFLRKRLTGYRWADSFRIARNLVWVQFPLACIYAGIVIFALLQLEGDASEEAAIALYLFLAILVFWLVQVPFYFAYCGRFLLNRFRRWTIFASTLSAFIAAFVLSLVVIPYYGVDRLIVDWLHLSFVELPAPGSNDMPESYAAYMFASFFAIAFVVVSLTAYLNFATQKTMTLKYQAPSPH